GKPLLVRYDLEAVAQAWRQIDFARRAPDLWRYRELLPLPFDVEPITLGETMTPLIDVPALADELGLRAVIVKDEGRLPTGSFNSAPGAEPYRIEGQKTMGLGLAEQLGWTLPDAIFYPTGGGTGLIGMWKVFAELEAIGAIGSKRPRMVAIQSRGCAPIVAA